MACINLRRQEIRHCTAARPVVLVVRDQAQSVLRLQAQDNEGNQAQRCICLCDSD